MFHPVLKFAMAPSNIMASHQKYALLSKDCIHSDDCKLTNMEHPFQNGLYERHIRPLFPLTTWLAFLDLDEFMYGREESTADYLRRVPHDIARLEVGVTHAHQRQLRSVCSNSALCMTSPRECQAMLFGHDGCIIS